MKRTTFLYCLAVLLATLALPAGAATVYTFVSSGVWICPEGVTSVQVECWGGGGAGGAAKASSGSGLAGGGGGGGVGVGATPG